MCSSDLAPGMQKEAEAGGLGLRERQTAFTIDDVPAAVRFPMPFPQKGRQKNDLTVLQKIGWIVAVAILSPVAFSAIISSLEIWSRLSRHN